MDFGIRCAHDTTAEHGKVDDALDHDIDRGTQAQLAALEKETKAGYEKDHPTDVPKDLPSRESARHCVCVHASEARLH